MKNKRESHLQKFISHINMLLNKTNSLDSRFKKLRLSLVILLLSILSLNSIIPAAPVLLWPSAGIIFITFIIVSIVHKSLKNRQEIIGAYLRETQRDLSLVRLDWSQVRHDGLSFEEHAPFLNDLDITGKRSLFSLLNHTVSEGGQRLLMKWVASNDPRADISLDRQAKIRAMMPKTSFRRRLFLLFSAAGKLESGRIRHWLHAPAPKGISLPLTLIMTVLGLSNLVLVILHLLTMTGPLWIPGLILYFIIMILMTARTGPVLEQTSELESSIRDLRKVLLYLEGSTLSRLDDLKELFTVFQGENSPSRDLRLLDRTVNLIGWRSNFLMALLLNAFVPWDMYCARLSMKGHSLINHSLPLWLDAVAHIDALGSISHFAWLHPQTVFPELTEGTAGIKASALGHPLIPVEERVSNNLSIEGSGSIHLITGSNMSGKSSFLKTIGINLLLAYLGAPVFARQMTTGMFRLASCININDSITAGYSFFYTEVRRLKAILELCESEGYPVLFLIDEIFKGTNNKERLVGSRSLILALSRSRGLGFVTTHDLELVALETESPNIVNFHFRENIKDRRMSFDYTLRSGPCPTTNALKIMEIEGLPVEAG